MLKTAEQERRPIMAKINKYWGLVAVGALTAAAAGRYQNNRIHA